ncbi:MAG: cytochrome c [Acidobacteriia bacterium]|nr:cytochrome c [Terriglobia bacterium]
MNWTGNGEFSGKGSSAVRVSGRLIFGVLLAGVLAACLGGAMRSARAASPTKTTMDGVYTDDQAKRGKAQYNTTCSGCHMEDLSGSGQALPLAGDAFGQVWEGQTVADLFNLIETTMPQDKPGALTPEASLDVISYLLQFNQFPAGKEELKNDPEALKNIIITKNPAPQGH